MTASERIREARQGSALPQTPRETRGLVEISRSLVRDASGRLLVVVAYGYPLRPWVDPLASTCEPL